MRYSRQNKILELINSHEIGTQEDLATLLRESGFNVTQATVSRDIKELQLVKVLSSKGKYKYASRQSAEQPPSDRFTKIFRETITSFDSSGNIIVVSIAGDNTMFLLVDSEENVPLVLEKFREMLDTRSAK